MEQQTEKDCEEKNIDKVEKSEDKASKIISSEYDRIRDEYLSNDPFLREKDAKNHIFGDLSKHAEPDPFKNAKRIHKDQKIDPKISKKTNFDDILPKDKKAEES